MAGHAVSKDGTRIAFDAAGAGPALVLVEPPLRHRRHSAFDGLAQCLESRFTVYRYDRRGRGESTDHPSYHPDLEVEDLAAVIDCAGASALVYGYSAGAVLALRAAARIPGIARLAVLEPPLKEDDATTPDPLIGELAALLAQGKKGEAVRHFHCSIGVPDEHVAALESSPQWPQMVQMAHTLVYDCLICDSTLPDMLRDVKAHTLVLDSTGSSDPLSGWAQRATSLIPHAVHRRLPGEWHSVADPVLAMALIEFFSAQ